MYVAPGVSFQNLDSKVFLVLIDRPDPDKNAAVPDLIRIVTSR